MSIKTNMPKSAGGFVTEAEAATDAQMENFIAEHHDEIEAKLKAARASIARGEAVPLEPLDVLLSDARRQFETKS